MYEDRNVHEIDYTVVFTIATDDENEPAMRGELVQRINALAEDYGCAVEIHAENMLSENAPPERKIPMPEPGQPFPCPGCGGSDWKADYYEAVWQDVLVVTGDNGEPRPDIVDYTGVTGTYDDGSTENESLRCRSCDYEIPLLKTLFVDVAETSPESAAKFITEMQEDVGYSEDEDQSVDFLIDYKNALEDLLGELIQEKGLPAGWTGRPLQNPRDKVIGS